MLKKWAFLTAILTPILMGCQAFAVEDLRDSGAGAPEDPSAARQNPLAQEAVNKIRAQFETLRLDEADFRLSPGWEQPFTIPSVENFFAKPLDIPLVGSAWSDRLEAASKRSEIYSLAPEILLGSFAMPALKPSKRTFVPTQAAASLKYTLKILEAALIQAQPLVNKAVDSLPAADRQGLLQLHEWPDPDTGAVRQEISAMRTKKRYEKMKPFAEKQMLEAGAIIIQAVDRALAALPSTPSHLAMRWPTPYGSFVISGPGDDEYEAEDLKDVAVLIDFGGKNVYKGPVATAYEKQIRIVIDLGDDVTIDGTDEIRGSAGAGVFGIGVMALPNTRGIKTIDTGAFSQGFGMGGVGALFINGPAHLNADRFVQGTGVFGVGILSVRQALESTYVATRNGQGAGFTRGVGIFLHEGDKADIKGGLVQPDPREPLGSVSLCQGVGMGPRAYAGGGVGIAVVRGNDISVKGSYFSQGVGYWHAFGVFRLRGDRNTLQARRYDMGSGVHSAFGHFDVYGNANRILNWGVGPSYGWDHSAGSSLVQGDDNEIQTEWGSGTASIGSVSFSYYRSNRGKFKLCDFGTNNFFRDEASYSIQLLDGAENQLACHGDGDTAGALLRRMRSPWGLFQMKGFSLDNAMKLEPAVWPEPTGAQPVERTMADLQTQLEQASHKSALEEVSELVDIASAFSLDKVSPREALRQLLLLPKEKAALLIDALEPAGVDQLIKLSIVIPAHGDPLTRNILSRLDQMPAQKKTVLVNFLRMGRPSTVLPAIFDMIKRPQNESLKGTFLRTLGQMMNKDTGAEPGSRAAFISLEAHLKHPRDKSQRDQTLELLKQLQFGQSFGLLASAVDLKPEDREKFFESAPEDLSGTLQEPGAKAFLSILTLNKRANVERIQRELNAMQSHESIARTFAIDALTSTKTAIVASAVITLGQIANPEDATLLEAYLTHKNTPVREAAAVALARLGEAGVPVLSKILESGNPRSRALVMAGISQAVSDSAIPILEKGLTDADPIVRLTAVSVLDTLPVALQKQRPGLLAFARKRLSSEEDPDVKLALSLLK